jgi:hypothetical protein
MGTRDRSSNEKSRNEPSTACGANARRDDAKDLAAALGVNERAVRFWERKRDRKPTSAPNDARIEQALIERGVILFAEPTLGARLAEKR